MLLFLSFTCRKLTKTKMKSRIENFNLYSRLGRILMIKVPLQFCFIYGTNHYTGVNFSLWMSKIKIKATKKTILFICYDLLAS